MALVNALIWAHFLTFVYCCSLMPLSNISSFSCGELCLRSFWLWLLGMCDFIDTKFVELMHLRLRPLWWAPPPSKSLVSMAAVGYSSK